MKLPVVELIERKKLRVLNGRTFEFELVPITSSNLERYHVNTREPRQRRADAVKSRFRAESGLHGEKSTT